MEALLFAKEVTAFVNDKYPQFKVRLYRQMFGEQGKIHYIVEIKDLATYEQAGIQLSADPEYIAITQKAVGLFIEGRSHDTVMSAIP